jgi:hypothetical protein
MSSIGTCEFAQSGKTCRIAGRASGGRVCSYCRYSVPSVFFQPMLALIP